MIGGAFFCWFQVTFSHLEWAVAHAAGGAQCGEGGGDDARQHLQNRFPSVLLHS